MSETLVLRPKHQSISLSLIFWDQKSKVSVSVSNFETRIQKSRSQSHNARHGFAHHWIFELPINWLSIADMMKLKTREPFFWKILKYQNANFIDFHLLTCNLYIFATLSYYAKVVRVENKFWLRSSSPPKKKINK